MIFGLFKNKKKEENAQLHETENNSRLAFESIYSKEEEALKEVTIKRPQEAKPEFEKQPENVIDLPKKKSSDSELKMIKEEDTYRDYYLPMSCLLEGSKDNNAINFRKILESRELEDNCSKLAFAVGVNRSNNVIVSDLKEISHLLIGGTTGSGKSNFINCMIMTLLMRTKPNEVGIVIIDPLGIEFRAYVGVPHLIQAIAQNSGEAVSVLQRVAEQVEFRYRILYQSGARNIDAYNMKYDQGQINFDYAERMEEIVVFIDFLSELLNRESHNIEAPLTDIIQKGARVGVHVVIASQCPFEKYVSKAIKSSIVARASMRVTKAADSKEILGIEGAEKLLGNGHMLYVPNGPLSKNEVFTPFVSEEDRQTIVRYWINIKPRDVFENNWVETAELEKFLSNSDDTVGDLLYDAGIFCIEHGNASASFLQRRFSIGFNRATKLIDELYEFGVIGPENGNKAREVMMDLYTFEIKWAETVIQSIRV